jgi:hypothetical protein
LVGAWDHVVLVLVEGAKRDCRDAPDARRQGWRRTSAVVGAELEVVRVGGRDGLRVLS